MNARQDMTRPVLLLGLGNSKMCDDGIGVQVVRSIEQRARELGADVAEAESGGEELFGLLDGRAAAVVVDAVRMPGLEPGAIVVLDTNDFAPSLHLTPERRTALPAALSLSTGAGARDRVRVVGIQIEDDHTCCGHCTSAVAAAEPDAGAIALNLVSKLISA